MRANRLFFAFVTLVSLNAFSANSDEFSFEECLNTKDKESCEVDLVLRVMGTSNELAKFILDFETVCKDKLETCQEAVNNGRAKFENLQDDMEIVAQETYEAANTGWRDNIISGLTVIPKRLDTLESKIMEESSGEPSFRLTSRH